MIDIKILEYSCGCWVCGLDTKQFIQPCSGPCEGCFCCSSCALDFGIEDETLNVCQILQEFGACVYEINRLVEEETVDF
jgi:hypothetical protein